MKDLGRIMDLINDSETIRTYGRQHEPKRGRKFPIAAMVSLLVYGECKGLGPHELEEHLEARGGPHVTDVLGFNRGDDGRFLAPKHSWISWFKNNVFSEFRDGLEAEISEKVLQRARDEGGLVFTADSTPLEASRYSKWADYNGHHRFCMAKAHLIMVNGRVLDFLFTNGNHGDDPAFLRLLERMDLADVRNGKMRKEMAKGRHICETAHHGMKRWVDHTVRGLHSRYIGHSLALKTMACQLLSLIFRPCTG